MNKLFLAFIPLMLAGCGYNSFYEANLACEEWKSEGGSYSGTIEAIKKNDKNRNEPDYLFTDTKNTFPMRKCQFDKETNQIIGLEVLNREKNKNYYFPKNQRLQKSPNNLLDIDLKWNILKRFKY